MSRVDELVHELEHLWIEPNTDDLAPFQALLVQRQRVLDELHGLDLSDLAPETREELQQRIDQVRKRDAAVIAYLREQTAEAAKKLDETSFARQATRAYLSPSVEDRHRGRIV
jgi:hypothetical protein